MLMKIAVLAHQLIQTIEHELFIILRPGQFDGKAVGQVVAVFELTTDRILFVIKFADFQLQIGVFAFEFRHSRVLFERSLSTS